MKFFGKKPEAIDFSSIKVPWDKSRKSIYEYIKEHLDESSGTLSEEGLKLPDDELLFADNQIRWVDGGMDGAFGHHAGAGQQIKHAKALFKAMTRVLDSPKPEALERFYSMVKDESTLGFIDPFLDIVTEKKLVSEPNLYSLAKWLLKNAPDREAVKAAIAILGVCATEEDLDLFLSIGKHEEFTLYATVAICHSADDPERALFKLAKSVDGWGRIHIIERLTGTDIQEIKDWMIDDGYKNTIMYEYTAIICATTGDLLEALEKRKPEKEFLKNALSILSSFNAPGPGIEEYEDAPAAIELLLHKLNEVEIDLELLVLIGHLNDLINYMDEESVQETMEDQQSSEARQLLSDPAWSNARQSVDSFFRELKSESRWKEEIQKLINDDDKKYIAIDAAKYLNVDLWEHHFNGLKEGKDNWWYVMQTKKEENIRAVVELAEEMIPLDKIATGPDDLLGMGKEFKDHSALDWVLQDLENWPGLGIKLVNAGLKSPVTRNRNMALKTLQAWGKENWEEGTENTLSEMLAIEPNERTREYIGEIISGKSVEDSH